MVRATAAEVLKLFGGVYPPGTDVTNIGNLCADMDYHVDGYIKKMYNTSLSTTDTSVIYVCNMGVAQLGMLILWYQAGGPLSGQPRPPILTDEMKEILDASISATDEDHAFAGDLIDTSDT